MRGRRGAGRQAACAAAAAPGRAHCAALGRARRRAAPGFVLNLPAFHDGPAGFDVRRLRRRGADRGDRAPPQRPGGDQLRHRLDRPRRPARPARPRLREPGRAATWPPIWRRCCVARRMWRSRASSRTCSPACRAGPPPPPLRAMPALAAGAAAPATRRCAARPRMPSTAIAPARPGRCAARRRDRRHRAGLLAAGPRRRSSPARRRRGWPRTASPPRRRWPASSPASPCSAPASLAAHQSMHDAVAPFVHAMPPRPERGAVPAAAAAAAATCRRAARGYTQRAAVGGHRVYRAHGGIPTTARSARCT